MTKIKSVLLYYQKKAGFAEQLSEPFQQNIIEDWLIYLSKYQKTKKWKVLDFGSGLGNNLKTLKKKFSQIVAVDVNHKALNFSKDKNGDNISYVLLKNEKLPFQDKTFDLILATEVFEHLPNHKEIMREIKRVIKKNGYFIISTPNYFNLTGIIKKFADRKNKNQMWGPWGGHYGGLERFTTWSNVQRLLSDFRIIFSRGADYQKSWFYNNPLFPVRFSKYILIWPGRLPFLKKIGMNYFVLAQKK